MGSVASYGSDRRDRLGKASLKEEGHEAYYFQAWQLSFTPSIPNFSTFMGNRADAHANIKKNPHNASHETYNFL